MSIIKSFAIIIALLILSVFAVKPLFSSGFFPIHDDTQVQRVFEMKQSLADGMFPVRWVSELGYNYGYPIFNFYAPLAYYVGGFLNLLSINALASTKLIMMLGMLMAGIFMYLFAKQFWGDVGGTIAGILYLYAPYHAVDLYVRGDIAEIWAYAFIPLAFYGLWKTYTDRKWKFVTIGSLAYAAIILSHNLTTLMATPFFIATTALLYILSYSQKDYKQQKNLEKKHYILVILLLGILLSAFYWMPTLLEMQYTNVVSQIGGGADFHDHFVCIKQLWDSPWGYGGSTRGCVLDGLSFKIGKLHLLFAALSFVSLIGLWKKNRSKLTITIWFIISFFFSVFLMLDISTPIWNAIPHMAFVQYPWRFLIFTSFFSSFLGGGIFWTISQNKNTIIQMISWVIAIGSAAAIIFINAKVFVPQTIHPATAEQYTSFENITWYTSKISDEYLMKGIHKPKNFNEIPASKIVDNPLITVTSSMEKTQKITASVKVKQNTILSLHLDYFPAWHVFIDGQQTGFKYFNKGFLINLSAGTHTIEARYIQTPVEKIANAISLAGLCIIILGIITTSKETKHDKKNT